VDHPGYLASDAIPIAKAQSTVHVSLISGVVICGSVTDPNGLPAATDGVFYVQIFQERQGKSGPERVVAGRRPAIFVDDRGQYRSELLAPGTYYVAAICKQAPNFRSRTWRGTYYPHALDSSPAKAIVLLPGQQDCQAGLPALLF